MFQSQKAGDKNGAFEKREQFAISLRRDKRNRNLKIKRDQKFKQIDNDLQTCQSIRELAKIMLFTNFQTEIVSKHLKVISRANKNEIIIDSIIKNKLLIDFSTILEKFEYEYQKVEFQDIVIDIFDILHDLSVQNLKVELKE